MPGTPKPIVDPRFGAFQTTMIQAAQRQQVQAAALAAGATQGNLVDPYGNTVEVSGTNLNQTVTIGAAHAQPGVLVGTGIANGITGRAIQSGLATGTITVTQGSTSATLNSTTAGVFGGNTVIGAANVTDPGSGLATSAIIPGTTYTISGTSITLSQAAAESGSGIYCAACAFMVDGTLPQPIQATMNTSVFTSYGAPFGPVEYWKDSQGVVRMRGLVEVNTSSAIANDSTIATLPYAPTNRNWLYTGWINNVDGFAIDLRVIPSGSNGLLVWNTATGSTPGFGAYFTVNHVWYRTDV